MSHLPRSISLCVDLPQRFALLTLYRAVVPNRWSAMVLWIIRVLLAFSAMIAARFVGDDFLDLGAIGTVVVIILIIGFAVLATSWTIRHDL
jgi:hypothetical protein